MSSVGLDHAGVVTHDLAELAAQYQLLGFTLTPFARHADGRIGNRCVMLRRSYIELLAVIDPNARSATLERFLAHYAGIHILAFAIADERAELARLRRAGVAVPAASNFERPIDDADPAAARARLKVIQLPGQPEGRLNLVRHMAPDALWQERFLEHANNATALEAVEVAVPEPMETAARLSRLVGCPVVPAAGGGLSLDLAYGYVHLVGADAPGEQPRITGMTIRTSDGNAAVSRLLNERGIAYRRAETAVLIDEQAAGGVAIRFAS
jgi:hypothetical protein